MSSKVKVKIKNLYKIFGKNQKKSYSMLQKGIDKATILDETGCVVGVGNADFEIYEGETLVIMGLSGSGKSTLLRCINRLIEPTYGEVEIDGVNILELDEKELIKFRRKKFGMVFQNFALFPHKTIVENVAFGLEIQGIEKKERLKKASSVLKSVGLDGYDNNKPNELSGGMQQRVGLARALAVEPDILLMDEAFSALDPLIRTDMQDELLELEDSVKKTIIFITHDLDEALKIGDRIVLMKDGGVVQIGTADEILSNPATKYVSKFVENVDMTKVLTSGDVMAKPKEVAFLHDGPKTTLHKMKSIGADGMFVVKKNHELIGYISAKNTKKAMNAEDKTIESVTELYFKQIVSTQVPVKDLFKIVTDYTYPLAVVDDNKKLKGYIVESSIVAGLAEGGNNG